MSIAKMKELQKMTGMSILKCKEAWDKTQDLDKAIEYLKEQGLIKSEALDERATSEGILAVASDSKKVLIMKVACETDFTSNSPDFKEFATELTHMCFDQNITSSDDLSDEISEKMTLVRNKIKENIHIAELQLVNIGNNEQAAIYMHNKINDNLCSRACVVIYNGDEETAKDIAMHIVANDTKYVSEETIPEVEMKEITDNLTQQHTGKPEHIINKILDSGIKTFLKETTLMNQEFLKNPDITVKQLCDSKNTHVIKFYQYSAK